MKKLLLFTLIIFLLAGLCACKVNVGGKHEARPTFTEVYVCGAVKNEGVYGVNKRSTVSTAVDFAGKLKQSVLPVGSSARKVEKGMIIVVNYFDGGKTYQPINVNGKAITSRNGGNGIPQNVIDTIANYVEQNGKIRNKTTLKKVLGSLYEDYHYRFYVAFDDYEKDPQR